MGLALILAMTSAILSLIAPNKLSDLADEIQKGILAISEKEEPFDIFICYKETDANGRRTQEVIKEL